MDAKIKLDFFFILGSRIRCFHANNKVYVCLSDVFKHLEYTQGGMRPYIARMKNTVVIERDEVYGCTIKNYARFTSATNLIAALDLHCQKEKYKHFRHMFKMTINEMYAPF